MKLKFTADPKDWVLFAIFAIIWLYVVAVVLLNVVSFANATDIDNMFHGLNPFPAFYPHMIGYTIIFYIISLVAVIMSVSDKFFDREKGIGLFFGKKESKGYSEWLDERKFKQIKNIEAVDVKTENSEAGGIPLTNDGKKIWVDNGEGHSIVMGSSGSGKTQMIILPMVKTLAKHDESMIITDPKGEIYEKTSKMLKERGYNVVLLNFRNPQQGSGWNPLHLPYQYYKNGNKDKANELVDDLAVNILYDENAQNNDPFWEKTSADYFSGLCLALFEDAKEEEINLNSVNIFTTVGEEKSAPNASYVQEYFSTKDPASPAYVSASSTLIAPNETKGGILSVFKQKLRLFASRENISEMLSHSDFELADIGKKKTAVFIIIQDEKTTYHSLVTIFVKQCYETLIDYAQKCGGKLPYRTNFLLDEFANMPPLKDVETMVSAARSRNMRFTFIIQNFAQLNGKYGKETGDTIKGNCANIIYLISTELAALEEISKMCGEVKIKTGKGDKEKEETRPLITVSDLQKMKEGEIILLRTRQAPFRTKLEYDYRMSWPPLFESQESKDFKYPTREKEPIRVFDLKGFIREKKASGAIPSMGAKRLPMFNQGPARPNMPTPRNNKAHIDDLVKRIDARIAELEKEEAKEKAAMKARAKSHTSVESPTKSEEPNSSTVKREKKVEAVTTKEEPKKESQIPAIPVAKKQINISKDEFAQRLVSKVNKKLEKEENKKEYITDDQFFDDFFSDDDY